jgi:dCMP deaminase
MLIINCGIKRVVCEFRYHSGSESEAMFADAGIQLDYVNEEVLKYERQ